LWKLPCANRQLILVRQIFHFASLIQKIRNASVDSDLPLSMTYFRPVSQLLFYRIYKFSGTRDLPKQFFRECQQFTVEKQCSKFIMLSQMFPALKHFLLPVRRDQSFPIVAKSRIALNVKNFPPTRHDHTHR